MFQPIFESILQQRIFATLFRPRFSHRFIHGLAKQKSHTISLVQRCQTCFVLDFESSVHNVPQLITVRFFKKIPTTFNKLLTETKNVPDSIIARLVVVDGGEKYSKLMRSIQN